MISSTSPQVQGKSQEREKLVLVKTSLLDAVFRCTPLNLWPELRGVCWGNRSRCRRCVHRRWQSPGRCCFSFPPCLCCGTAGHDASFRAWPRERSSGAPWMLFHGPSVGIWVLEAPSLGLWHRAKLWKRSFDHITGGLKPQSNPPPNLASLGIP